MPIQPAAGFAGAKLPGAGKEEGPARGDERSLRAPAEAETVECAAREEERPQTHPPDYRSARAAAQTLAGHVCHAFSADARSWAVARKKGPIRRWGLNDRAGAQI